MKKQYLVSTALVATLILGIMTVNAFDDATNMNKISSKGVEKLKQSIPETFEKTDALITPIRNRFLLWTNDGKHIMWGFYGNGYFSGTDTLGKKSWGIYGKGVFAGFYDGNFFYGMYRNNNWKAMYLFNEKITNGKFVTFPAIVPVTVAAGTPE